MSLPQSAPIRRVVTVPLGTGLNGTPPGEREVDLWLRYVSIAWRRRWVILALAVLGLGGAMWFLAEVTPSYESSARLYISRETPGLGSDAFVTLMMAQPTYLYTQAELIRSTPVLQEAVQSLDAERMKTFAGVSNPVGFLRGELFTGVGEKDQFVTVRMQSPHATEAAQIVNAVVAGYIKFYGKKRESTAEEVRKILEEHRRQRGRELAEQHRALVEFRAEHEAIALAADKEGNGTDAVSSEYEAIMQAIARARLEQIDTNAEYESLRVIAADPAKFRGYLLANRNELVDPQRHLALKKEIDRIQSELGFLLLTATDEHPHVQRLKVDLQAARRDLVLLNVNAAMDAGIDSEYIERVGRQYIEAKLVGTQQRYEAITQKLADMEKVYEVQKAKVLELRSQQGQYELLQAEWEQTQKLVATLDEQIRAISFEQSSAKAALNIDVVETAKEAAEPVFPRRSRVLIVGLLLGLVAGGALGFVLDQMDRRLRTGDEAAAAAGVPVLGMIPEHGSRRQATLRGRWLLEEPNSAAAEAYRTIRTAFCFSVPRDECKTLLITSALEGEGKSTLTSNLGIALSQAGSRTLIIDADFRKPWQHRSFPEAVAEHGLSTFLTRHGKLQAAVQRTKVPRLYLMPTGPRPANPAELLNSGAFAQMLKFLRQRFDYVLIDSAPLLAVADTRIVAAHADAMVLVLSVGKATRRSIEEGLRAAQSVGARVIGAVVNRVPRRSRYYDGSFYDSPIYPNNHRHSPSRKNGNPAHARPDTGLLPRLAGPESRISPDPDDSSEA